MKRLAWDDRALDDLDAIFNYIAADSPRAAAKVAAYIRNAALSLETSPELGLASAEPSVRDFILTKFPYILVYEIEEDEVRVLAVFHHAQKRH